jgi:hypothetical protein
MAPAAAGRGGALGGGLSERDPAQPEEAQSHGCLGAHLGAHPLLAPLAVAALSRLLLNCCFIYGV